MADITPTDIEHIHFRKAMSGYVKEEVDEFLRQVGESLYHALEEGQRLRAQLDDLRTQVQRYQQKEELINNALVLAERTADEVRSSAHREADLIRREAEEKIRTQYTEFEALHQMHLRAIIEMRAFLQSQLSLLESQEHRLSSHQPTPPPGGSG